MGEGARTYSPRVGAAYLGGILQSFFLSFLLQPCTARTLGQMKQPAPHCRRLHAIVNT